MKLSEHDKLEINTRQCNTGHV